MAVVVRVHARTVSNAITAAPPCWPRLGRVGKKPWPPEANDYAIGSAGRNLVPITIAGLREFSPRESEFVI